MISTDLSVVRLAPRGVGGPPLLFDFVEGRYTRSGETSTTLTGLSGVNFARSGAGTAARADAGLIIFASGVPRTTDRGLLLEAGSTNRCAVFNANPDGALTGMTRTGAASATLTRMSSPAALAAAGLSEVATASYLVRLDNSAGATAAQVTVAGTTGSAVNHTFSAWISGGTGWIGRGGANVQTFAGASTLRRVVGANIVVNSGSALNIQADAGQIVDFILPQLEPGAVATSPIVTAGAATARGTDSASVIVPTGCSTWTATYGEGLTTGGSVTPGNSFDLIAGRPWLGGYLKTLVMN